MSQSFDNNNVPGASPTRTRVDNINMESSLLEGSGDARRIMMLGQLFNLPVSKEEVQAGLSLSSEQVPKEAVAVVDAALENSKCSSLSSPSLVSDSMSDSGSGRGRSNTHLHRRLGKMTPSWQYGIIDSCEQASHAMEELSRYINSLGADNSCSLPPLLTVMYRDSNGTFESALNVYLHVIMMVMRQVVTELEEKPALRKRERLNVLDLLSQFSLVAEAALKFMNTHRKVLLPFTPKIWGMRNKLYDFLGSVITQPDGLITPIVSSVSLDRMRSEEEMALLEKKHRRQVLDSEYPTNVVVDVGGKDYSIPTRILHDENNNVPPLPPIEEDEATFNFTVKLELVQLLLQNLELSLEYSDKTCNNRASRWYLPTLHSRLKGKFSRFSRHLDLQAKECRLTPQNCSPSLKTNLCQLEVKLRQMEMMLEDEIPEHLRRIIGVADQCSRQLTQCMDEIEEEFEGRSVIEKVSEKYLRRTWNLLQCFPSLWRGVSRIFQRASRSSRGNLKVKEFWGQVRGEVEELRKEIKSKEKDSEYSLQLRIPIAPEMGLTHLFRFASQLEAPKPHQFLIQGDVEISKDPDPDKEGEFVVNIDNLKNSDEPCPEEGVKVMVIIPDKLLQFIQDQVNEEEEENFKK